MTRTAILVSGNGELLQSVLDAMYFGEMENFELAAVISTEADSYAVTRAYNAGISCFVVEPSDFPTSHSYSVAISNKLKDMDIDLVVDADFSMPLGVVAARFKNRVIGIYPALVPAFDGYDGSPVRGALERGCKLSGATAFIYDDNGYIGPIISQQAVPVLSGDDETGLLRRITEEASWKLLPKAITMFCNGTLHVHGGRVIISEK